jgi:hypothetical protein
MQNYKLHFNFSLVMKQIITRYIIFYKKLNKMNGETYLKKSAMTTIKIQRVFCKKNIF